jgi:2-polyprenyl-3-methyl-5-hydroxy-6-metoxy-1,4-benzoquinol methylase
MAEGALISDVYREQCERLHASKPSWGSYAGSKHAARVAMIAAGNRCFTVLDYGCGKGTLKKALDATHNAPTTMNYDPATFPEEPTPADLVCCLDVLEHIEPECLDAVLDDIARLTRKVAFFVISTRLAGAKLPDGRNAHLIVKDASWWNAQLAKRFDVRETRSDVSNSEFHALCWLKAPE